MRRDSHIAWRLQYGSVSGSNLYNCSPTFRWENEGFIPQIGCFFPKLEGLSMGVFAAPSPYLRCGVHRTRSDRVAGNGL